MFSGQQSNCASNLLLPTSAFLRRPWELFQGFHFGFLSKEKKKKSGDMENGQQWWFALNFQPRETVTWLQDQV